MTGDLRLRIDPAATVVVDHGVAWAPAEFFEQNGERFAGCPRWRLRQVVGRLAGRRTHRARTGAELEFVLTRARRRARGAVAPWQGYGVRTALDVAPLLADLTDIFRRCRRADRTTARRVRRRPVRDLAAPGRSGDHRRPDDPGRILIGRAAGRHGLGVSFSPVPFAGGAGNGAHLHLSLSRCGRAAVVRRRMRRTGSPRGGAAIAGLVAGLPEVQAVLAGSAVSRCGSGPATGPGRSPVGAWRTGRPRSG